MKRLIRIEPRLTDKREFEICDRRHRPLVGKLNGCVNYQATDVMRRVVTFSRITSDIVNPLSSESFCKFFGEPDKEVKLMIEDSRVGRAVSEASVNATWFRAGLVKCL